MRKKTQAMASASPLRHFSLFIVLLPLLHHSPATAGQTYTNITLGSTFNPLGPNASWPSPSGDFAFGFRPLEPNNSSSLFLLAVWFAKTADQTVVWSANGNNPAPPGSKLLFTTGGQLSLIDPDGNEVWSPRATAASHAAILDTGNLVLAGSDSTTLWQSFDSPTDTILPTQVLGLGTNLQSRLTDADYSVGRFTFRMQGDGNLVSYPVDVSIRHQYSPYYASNTVGTGAKVVFNESGAIYLALKNGTQMNLTSTATISTAGFYHRATLDFDGVFRQYSYPKNVTAGVGWGESWTSLQTDIPSNICQAITEDVGSGACGFNSYCVLDGSQKADCRCPPQFSFIDPSHKYKGCKPNFALQSCTAADETGDATLFGFTEMTDTDWPLSDYEHYSNFNEDQCRKNCLSDCFCAVVIYREGECWKKKLPLSNGRMGNVGGKALIKVSKTNSTDKISGLQPTIEGKNDQRTLVLVESFLLGGSAFLNLLFLAAIFLGNRYYNRKNQKLEPDSSISWLNLRVFTYKELEQATNGFSEELGSGAFGTVYKGILPSEPRMCIAVKKLEKLLKETEKEFTNEVTAIGQTHHKNLVKLYGFCNEETHRLLVYEYMSNGSLTDYLLASGSVPPPRWNHRISIALGIARGILYLHEECSSQIIHCDIKPQNILLDDSYSARIADFGLAKLLRTGQTRTNTGIRGTKGYVAPEWFKNMAITAKVDVYSFGVMLLEIVCCRKNLELERVNEEEAVLTYWAYDCYKDGRIDLLVAGDEEAMADKRRVERFVKVAIWCIQEEPSMRPSMHKVTQMLEGAVEVAVPPDPSSYISSLP